MFQSFPFRKAACVTLMAVSIGFPSCGGGSDGGDASEGDASSGVPAARLIAGNTITFNLPSAVSSMPQREYFRIVSSSQAYRNGSSSLSGTYTYTTSGSTARFEYKYVSSSSDSGGYIATSRIYSIRFTSPSSGVITQATLSSSQGTTPVTTVHRSGTFRIN